MDCMYKNVKYCLHKKNKPNNIYKRIGNGNYLSLYHTHDKKM